MPQNVIEKFNKKQVIFVTWKFFGVGEAFS